MVADIEKLETMRASEIYPKRLSAKEVIFPKENEKFIFPVADGRIKFVGGDQELRTSTLIQEHPIRGESHVDFLGESEASLPPPQDSLPDAGEAINDFWSMSGNFIYRHHFEPRVKLCSPSEESFPIPLKYIDVSRTTHTNLDVLQESRIDDYWNIDGSRDLSDPWTGYTQFTLGESLPTHHEDHFAGKGENSLQHYNLVHKFILMPQAMKIPAAKAAVDKEWEKLEKISAWNLTKVRSKKEVIDEAKTSGATVHFASLMDICHLKMLNWRQSTKKTTKVELHSEVIL